MSGRDQAFVDVVDHALSSDDPAWALHGAIHDFLQQDYSRSELSDILEVYRSQLSDEDEAADEYLIDIMSVLDGWCSMWAELTLIYGRSG